MNLEDAVTYDQIGEISLCLEMQYEDDITFCKIPTHGICTDIHAYRTEHHD